MGHISRDMAGSSLLKQKGIIFTLLPAAGAFMQLRNTAQILTFKSHVPRMPTSQRVVSHAGLLTDASRPDQAL